MYMYQISLFTIADRTFWHPETLSNMLRTFKKCVALMTIKAMRKHCSKVTGKDSIKPSGILFHYISKF